MKNKILAFKLKTSSLVKDSITDFSFCLRLQHGLVLVPRTVLNSLKTSTKLILRTVLLQRDHHYTPLTNEMSLGKEVKQLCQCWR